MRSPDGLHIKSVVHAILGSLEKRLVGALLLIVACTLGLQVISQDRAMKLRAESEVLRAAAGKAEHAGQLVRTIGQFRVATLLYANPGKPESGSSDELTDAAIQIGEAVNALRMNGGMLDTAAFDDIDEHVGRILIASVTPAATAALEDRNARMAAAAAAINNAANAEWDVAQERLSRSTSNWHMFVSITNGIVLLLVLAILFDLLRNILPALRGMHGALRRLAAGDLDFEIQNFRLSELRALSSPLETFRRNALAVNNLAFTDPSTGMPNRRAFVERVARQLAEGRGVGERGFVVALADIDRFKHVNDDYGHGAGDTLVALIGERLATQLTERAVIARVGGDEFAIFAPLEVGQPGIAVGSRLVAAVRAPFDLGDCQVAVNISLGLIEITDDPQIPDVNALMNRADLALYAAKHGGRNCAKRFTPELEHEREVNRAIERDLAEAFETGQLRMVYQPIHPIAGGEDEVEALVRWHHPKLGEISPVQFIPAAERSGLMVQLGTWIVERAVADLAHWPHLTMSINLSPLQLQQDGFVAFLTKCCRARGIRPQRIFLEVTESLSIERNTRALLTLGLLRNAGFRVALDDFGTGYSSLCMMKSFRFDRLKLDRSLISDLENDPTSRAVFDAAVTMALRIGAEVVAEGISEEALVGPVRDAGCTHAQGFFYSRPIEADAIGAYYEGGRPPRVKAA